MEWLPSASKMPPRNPADQPGDLETGGRSMTMRRATSAERAV